MNTPPPLFSILVANYNNVRFFDNLFPSLINQTYQNIEIIFVDDASTDNSLEKVQNYACKDSRIKIFKNSQNLGCVPTKKKCIDLSSGEYFGFVDPDDYLELNTIEKIVETFDNHADIAMVYSNLILHDESLQKYTKHIYPNDTPDEKTLLYGFCPNHFSGFSKKHYNKTEGMDIGYALSEDRDLVLKMEEVGRVVRIPDYLYHYRINSNSISNNINAYKAQYWAWQARYRACERRGLSKEDVYSEIMSYIDGKRFDFSTTTDYKLGKKLLALPRWIKYKLLKHK